MSSLIINGDPRLRIEYQPTLVESTLEFLLDQQGVRLSRAKYAPETLVEDYDPKVFSFVRETRKKVGELSIYYQRVFASETSQKSLNLIIQNFDNPDWFFQIIGLLDKKEYKYLLLKLISDGSGWCGHYGESTSKKLGRIQKAFTPLLGAEPIDEKSYSFKWNDLSFSSSLESLLLILSSSKRA